MKKYLIIAVLAILSVAYFSYAETSGTFQPVTLPDPIKAIVDENSETSISFLYSGQGHLSASVISATSDTDAIPKGMEVGSISYGANGVDKIVYSGTPTETGSYSLYLILTDNIGTMANYHFTFTASKSTCNNFSSPTANPVTITTKALPDATVGQPYSATVSFKYTGDCHPYISFQGLPSNFTAGITTIGSGKGLVTIKGTPKEAGTFNIRFFIQINNASFYPNDEIPLLINKPAPQPTPIPQSIVNIPKVTPPPPTPVTVIPSPVPTVIQKPITATPTKKKLEPSIEPEIKSPPISEIMASTTIRQQIETNPTEAPEIAAPPTPAPVVKQVNIFQKAWRKFLSWF